MGLLWTTEGTRRLIETLNKAFDGPTDPNKGLAFIQSAASAGSHLGNKIAKRDWKPAHLSRMLKLLPYDQSGSGGSIDGNHTQRWHFFLRRVIGNKSGAAGKTAFDTVFIPLRNALADAILNQAVDPQGKPLNIVRVSFDHVELHESNATPTIVVFDLPDTSGVTPPPTVRHITLFTVPVQPDPLPILVPDQPDPDDQPPISHAPWET